MGAIELERGDLRAAAMRAEGWLSGRTITYESPLSVSNRFVHAAGSVAVTRDAALLSDLAAREHPEIYLN